MRDNGDGTVSVTFNCGSVKLPHDFEVSEGWAGVLRLYEPIDVKETLEYMETLHVRSRLRALVFLRILKYPKNPLKNLSWGDFLSVVD